ncbi:MAG: hypothetical protein R2851_03045 [Caldilineaceae bacterium]
MKQLGKTVALLEGSGIVEGVSAYTTAKVTSLHTLIYADLLHERGEATARIYGAANQAAAHCTVARFVERSGDRVRFRPGAKPTPTPCHPTKSRIQREVEAAGAWVCPPISSRRRRCPCR